MKRFFLAALAAFGLGVPSLFTSECRCIAQDRAEAVEGEDAPDKVGESDEESKPALPPVEVDPKWLDTLDRLGGDSFADRRRAADELARGGVDGARALDAGLDHADAEIRERSIELLRKATKSADAEVREVAKSALSRKNIPLGPASAPVDPQAQLLAQIQQFQLQQAILQRRAAARRANPPGFAQRMPGPPGLPGAPRAPGVFPPPGFQGNFQGSKVIDANGERTIEITRNGSKITAKQHRDGSIEGEITKTVDGKETTEEFSAKNAEDLAAKHPEAAERLKDTLRKTEDLKPNDAKPKAKGDEEKNPFE